jgi:hypothetical protein
VRLANVQKCYVLAQIQLPLELLDGKGGNGEHEKKLSVFSDQFSVFRARSELRTEN